MLSNEQAHRWVDLVRYCRWQEKGAKNFVFQDGKPTIDDTGDDGINFVAICQPDAVPDTPTLYIEEDFRDFFDIIPVASKDPANVAFTVKSDSYEIVSTIPFPVRIYVSFSKYGRYYLHECSSGMSTRYHC